jgi:hypothetical protein
MKRKYKKELQSIYEMSLSNDTESKDLAISLFWTSEYVQDNKIKPELSLYVTENGRKGLRGTIDYYTGEINTSRHNNFSRILDDLIHDNVYFVKEELK